MNWAKALARERMGDELTRAAINGSGSEVEEQLSEGPLRDSGRWVSREPVVVVDNLSLDGDLEAESAGNAVWSRSNLVATSTMMTFERDNLVGSLRS